MIVIIAVMVGFVVAIVAAIRLNIAVAHASERFRVLAGGYGDAGLLVEARRRFRQRQRSVEKALDTGTVGLKSAHRGISGYFGRNSQTADSVYDNMRALNRNVGRALSGWFAPGPKKRSESLDDWRRRHTDDASDREDDH